jgi:hypothetical protein
MDGEFHLTNEAITFRNLSFGVPGASIQLSGNYGLDSDTIDFHGNLRLHAKVSQTMTGWKRLALRPIDPLFSRRGAGTLLPIRVTGGALKIPNLGWIDLRKCADCGLLVGTS